MERQRVSVPAGCPATKGSAVKSVMDPTWAPEPSYRVDIAGEVDGPEDLLAEIICAQIPGATLTQTLACARHVYQWTQARAAEEVKITFSQKISHVVSLLLLPGNTKMSCWALGFALDLGCLNGMKSMRAAARSNGWTVAAMSKRKIWWTDQLGIRLNANSKSLVAVKSYKSVQRGNHWRRASVGVVEKTQSDNQKGVLKICKS